jgi:hypothetical protein
MLPTNLLDMMENILASVDEQRVELRQYKKKLKYQEAQARAY